jgi:hypothetical protein
VLADDCLYRLLGNKILLVRCLNEHIAHVCVLDFGLSDLDLCSALILQLSNSLSRLANYKAHSVVRNNNDVGVGRGSTVRSHHTIVEWLRGHVRLIVVELLRHDELLMPNFVTSRVVRCNDSLHCGLGSPQRFMCIGNQKHMLILLVIRLRGRALFLRPLTPDQDLAS